MRRLTHFVSHSWKTSRVDKLIALLMHFNSGPAVVVLAVVSAVLFYVELFFFDALPPVLVTSLGGWLDSQTLRVPFLCSYFGAFAFFVTLATAHRWQVTVSELPLQRPTLPS